jgi:predicted aspartyl protease
VLIPADVVQTLVRNGTLAPSDFIGEKTYVLADGSRLPSMTFRLRDLRVGDHRLQNVTASTGPSNSTALLGQSFLSRFKSWTLDNQRHVIVLTELQ